MTAPPDDAPMRPEPSDADARPPDPFAPATPVESAAEPAELIARLGEPGGEVGIGAPLADESAIPMLTDVLIAPEPETGGFVDVIDELREPLAVDALEAVDFDRYGVDPTAIDAAANDAADADGGAGAGTSAAATAWRPEPGRDADADLDRVALQLEAHVLEQLQLRTDRLIEGPLHDRLRAVIDVTVERLVDEVRETLRGTIRDAVGRAITEELARVHRELDGHRATPASTGDTDPRP